VEWVITMAWRAHAEAELGQLALSFHALTTKGSFEEAADELLNDYRTNGKRSLAVVERRVRKHLTPYFAGSRVATSLPLTSAPTSRTRQTTDTVLVKEGTDRNIAGRLDGRPARGAAPCQQCRNQS
jgi:glutathione S-transferase